MSASTPPRVIVLWCPDWPVTAARLDAGLPSETPVVLAEKGRVLACSVHARAESVRRGMRVREAQARCPEATVLPYDASLDARVFEPLMTGLEELAPGIQLLRPGLCAVAVRGAARFYGGERAAALTLTARLNELGGGEPRAGIADGVFTAEQAARRRAEPVFVVPAGEAGEFLAPFDVGVLAEASGDEADGIVTLVRRLGIRTLGDFAALRATDVRTRFGPLGARLHELASGRDSWPVVPRTPPDDLVAAVDFEPALEIVDQVAFGVRAPVERFVDELTARRLVATGVRVRLDSDRGRTNERVWLHPRSFTPSDLVDRVRWQAAGAQLESGIVRVTIAPEAVDALSHHEPGLWGQGPDERVHHALSRVQSMLGHDAVLVPVLSGGRSLADRQQLVAWGDRPVGIRSPREPWPGRLPAPLPGTVYVPRQPVGLLDGGGQPVRLTERGALDDPPARLTVGSRSLDITAWAGPWPIDERWWDPRTATRSWRFQVVDHAGCGWLLLLDSTGWWAEARYD